MSVAISMILLREHQPLPVAAIEREIRNRYPELEVSLTNDAEDTPSFGLKQGELILGRMPVPFPWTDLEGPCATSLLWKNAAEEVRAHQAHLVVTVLSKLDRIEEAILLTRCTAATLAACDAAIGVYWGNSTLVVPKNVFVEFAEKILPLGPPLDIWVDFRVGWTTGTSSAGFTQGMEALGHMEMEVLEIPENPGELRQRLHDLASHLLENGPVIRDGDTVGQDANEKIRVTYSESSYGNTRQVMRLQHEASPKRPWWKVM